MSREPIRVEILRITPNVRSKLASKHHLDADDVAAAVERIPGLWCTWHDDPRRGRRALMKTTVGGRGVLVVLYPSGEDGVWNLGSAYRL